MVAHFLSAFRENRKKGNVVKYSTLARPMVGVGNARGRQHTNVARPLPGNSRQSHSAFRPILPQGGTWVCIGVLCWQTRAITVRVMVDLCASVEYGLHCLLGLRDAVEPPRSARDLALFQGISPSFVAKIFSKLEKAGIVEAAEWVRGCYRLAREPEAISVLELVDAIEGR